MSRLEDVCRHHRQRVNEVLRRPSMFGRDEVAERLVLEAMAVADGGLDRWQSELDGLSTQGAFTSTGVRGAYRAVLPENLLRDATASLYAEIAHRCGWLDLDRACSTSDHRRLTGRVAAWLARDRTESELIDTFGVPSLRIGGTNPLYPKTLVYGTADPADDLIGFHLWNAFADRPPGSGSRGVHPEPMVLAVRHRPGRFPASFSFTPLGRHHRPTAAPR
jgi:hypothetical protein